MQPSAFHACLFASSECRHCRGEGWLALGTWKVAPGPKSVHGQLPVEKHRRRDVGYPFQPRDGAHPQDSGIPLAIPSSSLWNKKSLGWLVRLGGGHSLLLLPHRHQSFMPALLASASPLKLLGSRFPSLPTLIRPATTTRVLKVSPDQSALYLPLHIYRRRSCTENWEAGSPWLVSRTHIWAGCAWSVLNRTDLSR